MRIWDLGFGGTGIAWTPPAGSFFFRLYSYPIIEEKGSTTETDNKNLSESEFSNVALGVPNMSMKEKQKLKQ